MQKEVGTGSPGRGEQVQMVGQALAGIQADLQGSPSLPLSGFLDLPPPSHPLTSPPT